MKRMTRRIGRAIAATSVMGVLAAGCAANRTESETAADKDRESEERRAADTVYVPATGEEGGGGVGGAGEPTDPTTTDTAGVYGDPNAWPTGPLPGDTGVGGAGSPVPDTVWMDTTSPADTFGIPEDQGPGGSPGGGTGPGDAGPDIW